MNDKKPVSIVYEKWVVGGYYKRSYDSISLDELHDLIAFMADDQSSILFMETEALMFDVAVGEGLYSVGCLVKEENKNYRLLGDVSDNSSFDYLLGGQMVNDYPSRYIVSVDDAIKCASGFLKGRLDFEDGCWELHG